MMFGVGLSGLQDFVYDVEMSVEERRMRQTHAARRLRVRSAVLSLAPAVVAANLLRVDPTARLHYLGGGRLLAEADAGALDALDQPLTELYRWLVAASGGRLGAYWARAEGEEDLAGLTSALARAKWRSGRAAEGAWLAGGVEVASAAAGLGNPDWESDAGALLARDAGIVGFRLGGAWPLGPWRVEPARAEPDIFLAGRGEGAVTVAVPLHAPRAADGGVAELFRLAMEGEGAPYLAVLKLDGDRVGERLAAAMRSGGAEGFRKVSAPLGRFFGVTVPALLEREFPRLYLVYSGGDDLVLTGHFLAVARAALAIRDAYTREVGEGGAGPTLSAGISFYTRQFPILKAVTAADGELEAAKEARDAVSVGGCRLGWEAMRAAMAEVEGLCQAVGDRSINRGALALLRQLGEPFLLARAGERGLGDEEARHFHNLRLRSIPQLAYTMSRRTEWRARDWPEPVRALFDSLKEREDDWPRAALVGTMAAWATRAREEAQ
ncbi:MAG: hypothetical protein IT208_08585 [Chthonomonadales bacterium]|nr:hypothetical protein [Chthonomonadales bacterium]